MIYESIQPAYELYLILHEAKRRNPDYFTDSRSNTLIGAIFAGRKHPWRVVGITKSALDAYQQCDFSKDAARIHSLRRAHLNQRIDTTRLLLKGDEPMSLLQVAEALWERDETVICAQGQNKKCINDYLRIENPNWSLFAGQTIGWAFGEAEQRALRRIAEGDALAESG